MTATLDSTGQSLPNISINPDVIESEIFKALDATGDSRIRVSDLKKKFILQGLKSDDPRLSEAFQYLDGIGTETLDMTEFNTFTSHNSRLIRRALQGDLVIPDFVSFCTKISDIYHELKPDNGGQVADYIPQLAQVDPSQFGVSICTVDGQKFSLGNSETLFCAQSSCKPINYCLALENMGEKKVHSHVGREPSGRGFNELTLNNRGLPHNPMINAGAIMTCSLLKPELGLAERFEYIVEMWSKLTGGQPPGFNNPVYLSEKATADRNFALGYFMREKKAFPENINLNEVLEFYFQCCSLEVNSQMMAQVGATLASAGISPTTEERVLKPEVVKDCLSLMSSCGMYDFSGEFAFKIGLPAKSGVSGVVMVVIPNVMGICIWSPRLDDIGNSVRGTKFCDKLVSRFNFHAFDSLIHGHTDKQDPREKKYKETSRDITELIWAASHGDIHGLQQLMSEGIDLNAADYDGRTPLHLAASEGHLELIKFMGGQRVDINSVDRWGNTPLDDAARQGHEDVVQFLKDNGGVAGYELKEGETPAGLTWARIHQLN